MAICKSSIIKGSSFATDVLIISTTCYVVLLLYTNQLVFERGTLDTSTTFFLKSKINYSHMILFKLYISIICYTLITTPLYLLSI